MPIAQPTVSRPLSGFYGNLRARDYSWTEPHKKAWSQADRKIRASAYLSNKERFIDLRQHLGMTSQLAMGWDTYGAEAPNDQARNLASELLGLLENASLAPARLLPSAEGGIAMSFVEGEQRAEIEIYNTGEIAAATYAGQGEPAVWSLDANETSLKNAIEQFRVYLSP